MEDTDLMPIGKHKGKRMIDVPASYLIWLFDNSDNLPKDLHDYIEDNLDALRLEIINTVKF